MSELEEALQLTTHHFLRVWNRSAIEAAPFGASEGPSGRWDRDGRGGDRRGPARAGVGPGGTRSNGTAWRCRRRPCSTCVRSANLMDLAAAPPRAAERLDMRYRWISRLPGHPLIDVAAVRAPYGREVLARLAADGRRVVLMIGQTRATERHQLAMVAARVGGRAAPCRWRGG